MNIALLIDGENLPASLMPELNRQLGAVGDPIVKCVFGDFSENRLSGWIDAARDYCIEPVFQISEGKSKNTADIALTIRAMDLLHSARIDGFCLASSDRDFAPLATRLRQHGKQVYGFGEAKTNGMFRASFTEFFVLAPAPRSVEAVPTPPAKSAPSQATNLPIGRIVKFIRSLEVADKDGFVQLTTVAKIMRERAPELAAQAAVKGRFLKNLKQTGQIEQNSATGAVRIRLRRAS